MKQPAQTIDVRLLELVDAPLLAIASDDVFDRAADPRLSAEFLADPRHHIAGAIADDLLVGFASAVYYVHPDKPAELWINEVGVAPPYQRQGVGRRLMRALLEHGRRLGCKEAWVLTETDNDAAQRLYAASGGERETVAYFTLQL